MSYIPSNPNLEGQLYLIFQFLTELKKYPPPSPRKTKKEKKRLCALKKKGNIFHWYLRIWIKITMKYHLDLFQLLGESKSYLLNS